MYVNATIIPVETIPGIGEGGIRNSSVMHLIHCKNLCKFHNLPPPSTMKER
jgi:hypothetical protein